MYCTTCGSEIPDDAKFCTFCGEPIERSTIRQVQPPPQQPQPVPTPSHEPSVSKPRSSSAAGGIIAAICVVFIVGIVLLYFGATTIGYMTPISISMLVIGSIIILCIGCSVCGGVGGRRRRRGYVGAVGGGDCGGCDCSGCDCGDCDCGGCDC